MHRSLCLLACLFILLASALAQDILTIQNGDRMSGQILRCEGDNVIFTSAVAGEVKIPTNQITTFESSRTLYFRMNKGNVLAAQPAGVSQGKQVLNTALAGQVLVDRAEIVMVGTDEMSVNPDLMNSQEELKKTQEALDNATKVNKLWSGYLQLNFSGSTGNKESIAFAAIAHAERKAASDKFEAHLEMRYGEVEDEVSDKQVLGYLRETVDITERLYVYGRIEGTWDEVKDIDLSVTFELGGGVHALKEGDWHLFESDRVTLDIDLGATYTVTDYGVNHDTHSAGMVLRVTYHHYFPNNWHLFLGMQYIQDFQAPQNEPDASSLDGRRFKFEALLEVPIVEYLSFTTSARYEFNNAPGVGVKKGDFYWLLGLKVNI